MIQLAIGLDLRRHSYRAALVDKKGNVNLQISDTVPDGIDISSYYDLLEKGVKRLTHDLPDDTVIRGVGISAPNGNYYTGRIVNSPSLPFNTTLDIVQTIKKRLGYKLVVVTNDADAVALGELLYGGARNMSNFIEVIIRFGLGAGIIVDRHVMQGKTGISGELGHTKVNGKKRKCGCGKTGCLETFVSHQGIMRNIIELSGEDADALPSESTTKMKIDEMLELVNLGNPKAVKAFSMSGAYLGEALSDLDALFDPEAIFIQGYVLKAGDAFLKPLNEKFNETSSFASGKAESVLKESELPIETANLLGASAIIWKELGF